MYRSHRREFLADVGRAMVLAGIGPQLAGDLGIRTVRASEESSRLTFGAIEPLVDLMQSTPADRLQPMLVAEIAKGTKLDTLLAAGALANARTFGGQDYIGFHTFMALVPAGQMARELPSDLAPLPVLKVLYRNASRMQAFGGRAAEVLHPVELHEEGAGNLDGETLRERVRKADFDGAEQCFAAMMHGPAGEAYNHLQFPVQDEEDVHRVVLAWRAWSTLDLTGQEHAHTLLRQSVRYCCDVEARRKSYPISQIRTVLPKLLDQYRLLSNPVGDRQADDQWIQEFSHTIFGASREQAAEAAAAALAEGISPDSIGEAISLAATQLVLFDNGRVEGRTSADKPVGSVHGDSVGVHASDAANAWRSIATVSDHRNTVASLILAASHTAGQSKHVRTDPFPFAEHLEGLANLDSPALLAEAETAIKANDQSRVSAVVHTYGQKDMAYRPLLDLMLRYSVSEDGSLHAEKYYTTASQEFERSRPAFRWQHLTALGRVVASEHGRTAPGYVEARDLLRVGNT